MDFKSAYLIPRMYIYERLVSISFHLLYSLKFFTIYTAALNIISAFSVFADLARLVRIMNKIHLKLINLAIAGRKFPPHSKSFVFAELFVFAEFSQLSANICEIFFTSEDPCCLSCFALLYRHVFDMCIRYQIAELHRPIVTCIPNGIQNSGNANNDGLLS